MKDFKCIIILCCFWIFILLIQLSCMVKKPEVRKNYAGARPLTILIESKPFLVGADTPKVALYDDGTLIYLKKYDKMRYFYVKKILDGKSLNELRKLLSLTDNFIKLKKIFNLTNITDLFTVRIYISDGEKSKAVSVYGMIPETTERPAMWVPARLQKPDRLPEEFKKFYDIITNISYQDAEFWIPDYIEILIWPYGYESDKEYLPWPGKWPSLSHPLTRKYGDSYSLYIAGTELYNLKNFLSERKQGQAVLIDGKKWSISYRFVFPGEFIWQDAFHKK